MPWKHTNVNWWKRRYKVDDDLVKRWQSETQQRIAELAPLEDLLLTLIVSPPRCREEVLAEISAWCETYPDRLERFKRSADEFDQAVLEIAELAIESMESALPQLNEMTVAMEIHIEKWTVEGIGEELPPSPHMHGHFDAEHIAREFEMFGDAEVHRLIAFADWLRQAIADESFAKVK